MKNIFETFDENKNKIAISYINSNKKIINISYSEFAKDIQSAIGLINEITQGRNGKHFAILAKNNYEYLVWIYAIIGSNNILVPLNIEKSFDEIYLEIKKAEIDYIIHDGIYIKREPKFITLSDIRRIDISSFYGVKQKEWITDIDSDDLVMIMFTSGTLGNSKGVEVSYRSVVENCVAFAEHYSDKSREIGDKIKYFSCLPLYHIYGLSNIMSCVWAGYEVDLCCDFKYLSRDIKELESNCCAIVPTILNTFYRLIKNNNNIKEIGNIREIMVAGAMSNPEIVSFFIKNGINVTIDYGLTEIAIATINNSNDIDIKIHSVGKAFGKTKVKIENGEVLFKGDSLMKGYYNEKELTLKAIQDGWFHTGDLGYIDENGYLFLTGRKKNLIILESGENINPEEIENILYKNNDIKEVVVKERKGKILALIYCDDDRKDSIYDYINNVVNKEVALYKRINLVEFVDKPLPKTGSGKIKRY